MASVSFSERGDGKSPASGAPDPGITVAAHASRHASLLTREALTFLARLHRSFEQRRQTLLRARQERQQSFDAGALPDFPAETADLRAEPWQIAPIPADLLDRRVEITGPAERKMTINALNSGASCFMADLEDSLSPTWVNLLDGQATLRDRWHGGLAFTDDKTGKHYAIGPKPARLLVRPRGWHLPERHVEIDGAPMSGALFDFGLYAFHNARTIAARGETPAFYLPKMESHREAALWADVFADTEVALGLSRGTLKATILIETLPAAFELDEILYAMRDHIVGLNCGRWDYIFSAIKRLGKNPAFITPDRRTMTMGKAFLHAYSRRVIQVCHRRGAFAMGGMAAQIPNRNDPVANEAALANVRADKEREARDGHDGTWVAHPDLVPVALDVFNRLMPGPNQLDRQMDQPITAAMLLELHPGGRTEAGLRENIRVAIQYIEAWLRGRGAVPLYNLMEDAATAEICRTQVWQWLYHGAKLEDGRTVTLALVEALIGDEMATLRTTLGRGPFDNGRFEEAVELFSGLSFAETVPEFLTLAAYDRLE